MALWGALGATARRYLERARDLEWQQERRLLEAYVRGRDQRRRGRKRRNRKQERRLLGTHGRLRTRILLATDGSEDAALAARAAADLSDRARARLHVVHVWQGLRPAILPAAAIDQYSRAYQEWEREARVLLDEQTERLRSAGGTVAGAHLRKGRPAEEIVALAEELGAGLVVLGSRGLGLVKRLVVGSVAEGVVSLAPCPVLVVRGGEAAWPPSRTVVGDDSSEEAKEAGEVAVAMAATLGAGVSLVRAYPVILDISEAAKLAEDVAVPLQTALRRHELSLEGRARALENELGHSLRIRVREGEAASVILEAAEEGGEPTLIAVGRRGLGRINRLRLGSVSADVLRSATGPVLIVPAPDGA
ncbi:MAG: universal stress protein [Actinomycetota bacterium]|nr:universal stress protein [Actinomycetota bacterium]